MSLKKKKAISSSEPDTLQLQSLYAIALSFVDNITRSGFIPVCLEIALAFLPPVSIIGH